MARSLDGYSYSWQQHYCLGAVAGQPQERLGLSERPTAQAPVQVPTSSERGQTSGASQPSTAESVQPQEANQLIQPSASQSDALLSYPVQDMATSQSDQQAAGPSFPQAPSQPSPANTSSPSAALPAGLDRQVYVFKREAIMPGTDARYASLAIHVATSGVSSGPDCHLSTSNRVTMTVKIKTLSNHTSSD